MYVCMYIYIYIYAIAYMYMSCPLFEDTVCPFFESGNQSPCSSNVCCIVFGCLAILRIEGCLNSTLSQHYWNPLHLRQSLRPTFPPRADRPRRRQALGGILFRDSSRPRLMCFMSLGVLPGIFRLLFIVC